MQTRKNSLTNLVLATLNIVFTLSVVGLLIRFFFRLAGANITAPIVRFIYTSTQPLLEPFRGIFNSPVVENGHVFEFSTLIAIVFYMLFAWLIGELVRLFVGYIESTE